MQSQGVSKKSNDEHNGIEEWHEDFGVVPVVVEGVTCVVSVITGGNEADR